MIINTLVTPQYVGTDMSERPEEKNSSLGSLLAGFEVELYCTGSLTVPVEIDCEMTELEIAEAFAAVPEVSIESMQSIRESLAV